MPENKEKENYSLLVVGNEQNNIQLLGNILKEEGYHVEFAANGKDALEWNEKLFHLILLDIMMPEMDGYEVCQRFKEHEQTRDIPVILLTAKTETECVAKGFEAGAADYITIPFNKMELLARVQTHLALSSLQHQLQKTNETLEIRVAERTSELVDANKKMQKEIADRREAQSRLLQINQIAKYVRNSIDLEEASHTFIEQAVQTVRAEGSGSILLYDERKNKLKFYASYGLDPQYVEKFEIVVSPETLYTYDVFISQQGKIIEFEELSPFQNEDTLKLHYGRKYLQQLVMPLVTQNKTIGLVTISHYDPELGFTDNDLQLLENISKNLSSHFENAQLYAHATELNEAYERFVPHEFFSLLDKKSILDINLGDQAIKFMSVLFSDIRSFTVLSEKMTPKENFRFINSYLSKMGPIVREHRGFIDKFIGDAIMALFDGKADDAVRAAIAMLRRLHVYNEGRKRAGYHIIEVGIGINTGMTMLGTLGEHGRMDGTVISDTVNTASRLEGLTKKYGTSFVISEHTYNQLQDPTVYAIRFIDRVKVRGKSEAISVYEVYDADPPGIMTKKIMMTHTFEEAWEFFQNKDFRKAETLYQKCLQEIPEDNVCKYFASLCRKTQESGQEQERVLSDY